MQSMMTFFQIISCKYRKYHYNVRICPPSCQLPLHRKPHLSQLQIAVRYLTPELTCIDQLTLSYGVKERGKVHSLSREFARHPLIMSVSLSIPASSANLTQGGTSIVPALPFPPNERASWRSKWNFHSSNLEQEGNGPTDSRAMVMISCLTSHWN